MTQERADATWPWSTSRGEPHRHRRRLRRCRASPRPVAGASRQRVFLATKTGNRAATAPAPSWRRSLTRMGIDQVDLIQLHNLVEPDEWEKAHSRPAAPSRRWQGRATRARAGSSASPVTVCASPPCTSQPGAFAFDSVLLPYNYLLLLEPGLPGRRRALLDLCAEREVAVQTIKSMARRRWTGSSEGKFSWYETAHRGRPQCSRAVQLRAQRHSAAS